MTPAQYALLVEGVKEIREVLTKDCSKTYEEVNQAVDWYTTGYEQCARDFERKDDDRTATKKR